MTDRKDAVERHILRIDPSNLAKDRSLNSDTFIILRAQSARIAELEAALAPFAAMIRPNTFDPKGIARFGVSGRAGNDDYRAAYAALKIEE
jgi:hypothetical protein